MLQATYRMQQHRQALALAVCLAPITPTHDLVVLNSAPEPPLRQLALSAARLMYRSHPLRQGEHHGLCSISRRFQLVRRTVDALEVLDTVGTDSLPGFVATVITP
ncbi:hypothetical protein [Streptomyces capillispiralis]|uniref:Uncharacterized protein n=1 Tax=Streptomyces capillispiralis TaxID=68182 RepID=A0A561SGE6_9ACTN|nr:hypothetical protein [Streptomyces capillispiralis]TWF73946.1 hypothetical protein FHX78_1365 [Streptomyces capillispiralis]